MKFFIFVLSLLIILTSSYNSNAQTKSEPLTNANVVSLSKAGLSKSVILTTIKNSDSKFDVTTNAIISLKTQGVSDDIIEAIVAKANNSPIGVATEATRNTNSPSTNDITLDKLDPGIYYMDEMGKPASLEASVFSQSKTGSGIMTSLTYGIAKTKSKAVLSGTTANTKIKSGTSVFYFIFPHNSGSEFGNQSGGALGWYTNAASPNEFLLIKFKVAKKGREVVTGSFGTYSGFSGGIDDDDKVSYRFSKISPGIYRVYFDSPITTGEYAFIFAGTSASIGGGTPSQKAYDFSVIK